MQETYSRAVSAYKENLYIVLYTYVPIMQSLIHMFMLLLQNAFLPTMPEDNLQEVLVAIREKVWRKHDVYSFLELFFLCHIYF